MKKLFNSFGFAMKGVFIAVKEQQNMRIHLAIIALVIIAGIYFELSAIEWSVITLMIGVVLTAEILNTAIEELVNFISPEFNPKAGRIKDISAGAVFTAAMIAVGVGVYIFGNRIFNLLF